MHTFNIWAPNAESMAVKIREKRQPMQSEEGGWWTARIEEAGPGTDYSFVIDDGDAVPDPRSPWQPYGIHGPSRLVDHSAFQWTDASWQARPLSSAIIYELHIGTFTPGGTFKSTIEKLDYLVDLGITHVEIMPVNEFSGDWGWGYDGVDLYAPQHSYGTPDDLKQLVNACHEKGLAVLLDVVYNHFGPVGNYLSKFGPYFTDAYHTPWGEAVNLDHAGSAEVRRFLADNALMWLRDLEGTWWSSPKAILTTRAWSPAGKQADSDVMRNGATISITLFIPRSRASKMGTTQTSGRWRNWPSHSGTRMYTTASIRRTGTVFTGVRH
jgi:maltooligosyltrehalose trehalohydrolase